jgi:hypothetical protein
VFSLPKKFEFQPHREDEVSKWSTGIVIFLHVGEC